MRILLSLIFSLSVSNALPILHRQSASVHSQQNAFPISSQFSKRQVKLIEETTTLTRLGHVFPPRQHPIINENIAAEKNVIEFTPKVKAYYLKTLESAYKDSEVAYPSELEKARELVHALPASGLNEIIAIFEKKIIVERGKPGYDRDLVRFWSLFVKDRANLLAHLAALKTVEKDAFAVQEDKWMYEKSGKVGEGRMPAAISSAPVSTAPLRLLQTLKSAQTEFSKFESLYTAAREEQKAAVMKEFSKIEQAPGTSHLHSVFQSALLKRFVESNPEQFVHWIDKELAFKNIDPIVKVYSGFLRVMREATVVEYYAYDNLKVLKRAMMDAQSKVWEAQDVKASTPGVVKFR